MKRPSTRFLVAMGLASLLASVLLLAIFIGVVPDRISAIRLGRAALAESLAASASTSIAQRDSARVQAMLAFIVERNPDLLSAAVRTTKGAVVAEVGDHASQWIELPGAFSIDSQVRVPILQGSQSWGTLDLRFKPLSANGWRGYVFDPRVQMVVFVVGCCFIGFYFYLGRVLRQLDPSSAVPERVRAALDTMAGGLLVVDNKGYIVLANQAFASIVGKKPDSLTGQTTQTFRWLGTDRAALSVDAYPWAEALKSGVAQRNARVSLEDSTGKLRSFLVNSSPVLGNGGKHGGVLISFDDVTQLQEKEIELRGAKDDAEAANRAKSDFLANMSHEIRTPMNAVLGFTDLLRRGYHKSDAEMSKHLNTIHSSGKHLLELINDILDLAKVESGKLELESVACAPHLIISEVVEILGVRAQEKGIYLRFECAGPVPATISSDPSRLRQIVTNLVGNAIKFTDSGGVRVVMQLRAQTQPPVLCIDVVDSGIGIPDDRLNAVFEPFVQAEGATTRQYGGTGLGLTISRRFARGLGGDIVARSQIGKGSVFAVTLDPGPLNGIAMLSPQEATAARSAIVSDTSSLWTFPKARVLLVDDGEANRELVRLVLEEVGLQVSEADNGRIAVEKAATETFDAILMDMQMPVMDGFTATRILRQRGMRLPIIALTANAMKGFEDEVIAAGCSGYLTKPVDIDALLETLGKILGGQRSARPALKHERPEPITSDVETLLDASPIFSRLADHPRLSRVARKFALQMPERMAAIEAACFVREFETLEALAHWLKGSGGTTGYDAFTAPAKRLEELAKANSEQVADAVAQLRRIVDRLVAPDETPSLAQTS